MNREEIAEMLRRWIDGGCLFTKSSTGMTYSEINRKIASGEYLATSFESLVATDRYVRDELERLIAERRIMDGNGVKVHKDLCTLYAINMACANGKMLRFSDFGKSCPLYID